MRGERKIQSEFFSYIPLESRVPRHHPLRPIRDLVENVLDRMSPEFDKIYSRTGRPGVPPEQLLKALLLQVLFTIRSEAQLVEHIRFNLLYRWFVGLAADDEVWDETTFCKNRDRLLQGEIARKFFHEVLELARQKRLLSKEHFTVDGTTLEAWASIKSLKPKEEKRKGRDDDPDPRNPSVDFKGQTRNNQTHRSSTDPESRIYSKANGPAKLSFMGHVLMENRNGLAVEATVTTADGFAERVAGLHMLDELGSCNAKTLGGDKHYDDHQFCQELRKRHVTPHVSQNLHARKHTSAVDWRTMRHPGYAVSIRRRKRIEEIFGWLKTVGPMRKTHFRGRDRVGWMFEFALAAYNLVRIRNLTAVPT